MCELYKIPIDSTYEISGNDDEYIFGKEGFYWHTIRMINISGKKGQQRRNDIARVLEIATSKGASVERLYNNIIYLS